MNLDAVSSSNAAYQSTYNNTNAKDKVKKSEDVSEESVIYESSADSKATKSTLYSRDDVTVNRLNSDLATREQQLQSLVEKLLAKQGKKFSSMEEMFSMIRSGDLQVDAETAANAQAEISEDGYWGVNQTSDRLVEMAQALAGNDPEKADKMISAIQKGFDQAAKVWGGKLPDICQKTVDSAIEKLNKWKESVSEVSTQDK